MNIWIKEGLVDHGQSYHENIGAVNAKGWHAETYQDTTPTQRSEADFLLSLDCFITYFDKSHDFTMKSMKKNESIFAKKAKESYQDLLRQFRANNEEISLLKGHIDKLRVKKSELSVTNTLLIKEISVSRQRELDMKEVVTL